MFALLLVVWSAFQEPVTFRAGVSLVRVDVEVRQAGRLVDGLTKDDFLVRDGGVAREILYFGHEEEALDIILLFDTSASMRPVVSRVAESTLTALGELRTGDRVAVMAFDAKTDLIADFTEDPAAVERTIREQVLRRPFTPRSHIQQGVDDAARHFLKEPRTNRRRAVLIVTDNIGVKRQGRALFDLWEADAVLSGLIVRSLGTTVTIGVVFPPVLFGMGGISGIAQNSGGDTLNADDAGVGFKEMIHRLRLRYSLHYATPEAKPGEERKIQVELSADSKRRYRDAKVSARRGYIAK